MKILKILQFVALFVVLCMFMYHFHMQMNGHPEERVECWKIGGILWHTWSGELVCIKPENK